MAKRCEICGRGPQVSVSRSHSHIATKRWQGLNLQIKKIGNKKLKVCTRCLKKLTKEIAFHQV